MRWFLIVIFLFAGATTISQAFAITLDDYKVAVTEKNSINIPGITKGDGKSLNARLYKPPGDGPFPAMVALHGAGGVFPYQLWWAQEISKQGLVVLFIDSYCTREYLCAHDTDDRDPRRKKVMQAWQDAVDIKQRMYDAGAGYMFLSGQSYVKKDSIGLIGWSWGGTTALFMQKMAKRFNLANGGFKGTISFYPNLEYIAESAMWKRAGKINQPTLVFYGQKDQLESAKSYKKFVKDGHPGPLEVVAYEGATRKFDELGKIRKAQHPTVGSFTKAFHKQSFEDSRKKIREFLETNFQ